jgi:hypothetical protein
MAQLREKFSNEVPVWIQRIIKKWKKIFNLNDWYVSVRLADDEKLGKYDGEHVDAFNRINVPYRTSHIHLGEHLKNDDLGRAIVWHELRHIHYEPLSDMIDLLIERYVPESERKLIKKPFNEEIESLIEKDVYLIEQVTEI